ncbi:hypothetical protein EDC28_101304 [Gallaecimonas pentaromativorans]|uniref:Uncharacterized protein n=1 Tax=Gallaecimonas pentaromativorans TaxID=584787 RepID=A0A3N1PRH0_9GAMM|nr:hypothetical protein EDC28_101304 [Gallaecimonas pentaromativorans]
MDCQRDPFHVSLNFVENKITVIVQFMLKVQDVNFTFAPS